eukprot:m.1645693 g.1645693  ORF g.1645693 m.1645693 type:complete len:345 (-) comp68418_c0_seq1:26-1060(-)
MLHTNSQSDTHQRTGAAYSQKSADLNPSMDVSQPKNNIRKCTQASSEHSMTGLESSEPTDPMDYVCCIESNQTEPHISSPILRSPVVELHETDLDEPEGADPPTPPSIQPETTHQPRHVFKAEVVSSSDSSLEKEQHRESLANDCKTAISASESSGRVEVIRPIYVISTPVKKENSWIGTCSILFDTSTHRVRAVHALNRDKSTVENLLQKDLLGKGAYGTVYLFESESGHRCAVKQMHSHCLENVCVNHEQDADAAMMNRFELGHLNFKQPVSRTRRVGAVYTAFFDGCGGPQVMELGDGTIQSIRLDDRAYFRQFQHDVLTALYYLLKNNLCYLDFTLYNVL